MKGTQAVGLPWPGLLAFLRLAATHDRGLARFEGLRWELPLAA